MLYSKKTLTQTSSSQAPLGLASEISFFFQPEMSLDIQGTTNMNQSSILFIGGSVGLSRYFLGSIPYGYEDATFKVSSYPTLSFYGSLAMTMRTFDLSGVETSTGIIVRDAKDIPQGTFMGPQLSLGGNVDFLEKFNFGLKAQMFQSISTSSAPDFTGQEFWIYLGYVF